MKRPATALAVALAAIAVTLFGLILLPDSRGGEARFCTSQGMIHQTRDGREIHFQDGGGAGPDGCDSDLSNPGTYEGNDGVIGFDCRLHLNAAHQPDTTFMRPNRSDGTCGQPGA